MFLRITGTDENNNEKIIFINERYIVTVVDNGGGTIIIYTLDGGRQEVFTEQPAEDIVRLISENERR